MCYDLFCFIHKPLFALSIARIYEFVNSFACELPAISRRYFCVQCPTKKLRSEKNLTQGQLAKEVGVSPGNVGDWETGKSKPGYNALASLARIFEVSADYLLEIEPSPAKASDDLFAHQKTAGLICDGSPLEGEEADLIAMYRLLPEEQREDIFDLVHLKYRKHVERKKESIYWTYHNGSSATKSGPAEDAEAQGGTA